MGFRNIFSNIHTAQTYAGQGIAQTDQNTSDYMKELQGNDIKNFPPHLYPQAASKTIDLKRLADISAGTALFEFFRFTVNEDMYAIITHYSIFNDALSTTNTEFIPYKNSQRILQYHGDPMNNNIISLGLDANMNNTTLISCNIVLKKGDYISWWLKNLGTVTATMGVRIVGYFQEK